MKRIALYLIVFNVFVIHAATWNVLIYMDASDQLCDMAIKNVTDMMQANIDTNCHVSIQLHAYDQTGLRYQLNKNNLCFIGQTELNNNSQQNLIDAAHWAFSDNQADYTMLILWNHGWGILDPEWNEQTQEWEAAQDALSNSCPIKRSLLHIHGHKKHHRGYMFSAEPRIYLSTQAMTHALEHITTEILHGNSIDILAFDTCMGSMLEVAYQIHPYANYLVGSQVCSLRDGFDYINLLHALKQNPKPKEMAQQMVHIFDAYYSKHDNDGIYAHSALKTAHTQQVAQTLDELIAHLMQNEHYIDACRTACTLTPRFCIYPMYTDIVSYIKHVERLILDEHDDETLQHKFDQFYETFHNCIVAKCAGFTTKALTHGCAIYLPQSTIYDSYHHTMFAQHTQWYSLLKKLTQ